MPRWAMVIDLRNCIGCGTCQEICNQLNNVPPGGSWRRLVERTIKTDSTQKRLFLTMSCMHCDDPPCLEVCPTGATYQRVDGIVDIKEGLCVGCGACVLACPYKARSINFAEKMSCYDKDGNELNMQDRIGICTKCDFCLKVVDAGLENGQQPGVDPDATPKCVRYCLGNALYFGDRDDPKSEISRLISENQTVCLQEELGTNPSVYYIPDDDTR